jgi:hypothetical protein
MSTHAGNLAGTRQVSSAPPCYEVTPRAPYIAW